LLVPPGLLIGAWELWRRRLLGPLFAVGGLVGMMSVYFFVDSGRSWVETLIMAQRLVMPASAFLLIGVALLLSRSLARTPLAAPGLRVGLAIAAPLVALAISWQHQSWQRPMRDALQGAERIAAAEGAATLGSSYSALKAAMMHRGPVFVASAGDTRMKVVLCSLVGASYRQVFATSCDLPGYETRASFGAFRVLVAR
jgi:hypothetical protein